MSNPLLAPSHDDLLRASAGACDTAFAWVAAAMSSGLSDYAPADLQELSAAVKTSARTTEAIGKWSAEMRSRLDRLIPASIHVHEETHFYQLISTPYGRLASEIERYWVADLAGITKLSETGAIDPVSFPIREWVERNLASGSQNRLAAEYAELAYTQTKSIKSCFSGSPFTGFLGHTVSNLTIGDALNSWPGFLCAQDRAEAAVESPDHRIQQVTHPSSLTTRLGEEFSAVPVIQGVLVSPRAILEGAALEIQLDWVRGTLKDASNLATILRLLNAGFMDETYLRTRHLVAKLLPDVAWPVRRSVLLTLSDLALWGPSHRDYVGGDDYDLAWEDLHPGYRFVRALEVLAEKRRYLGKSDLGKPSVVTELVCTELGWMTPVQMAQNYLQGVAADSADSPLAQDALQDYRIRAAKARLAEPAVFIDATNEPEIHERFKLVVPFIVEQGRLRMPDSPELFKLLFVSTISHLALGVFGGDLSRLFNEPRNVSDIVHMSALQAFFGEREAEFSQLLTVESFPASLSQLASEVSTREAKTLDDLIKWLSREGLDEFSRVVRTARVYESGKAAAVDWILRQPSIVEAVLDLKATQSDGSFTIRWPSLYGVLSQAINCSDVESLKELFDDCGYHHFNRDIEDLRRWPSAPQPPSAGTDRDQD